MQKISKQESNWIPDHPIKFTILISTILVILYVICAYKFKLGVNMNASTAISTDIALITIILSSIGLSISGYIFLNGYFGTVVEGDRSLSSIIEELNKAYIRKIIFASAVSMIFIAFAFAVIFKIKDAEAENLSAFINLWECVFQHLTYMGSIGSILYNFHFLCHIINPDQLIKKKAIKVANEQMEFLVNGYKDLFHMDMDIGWKWHECRKFYETEDSIRLSAGGSSNRAKQTLVIVKYIYEIEMIITKIIELNALEGESRSEEEALKFVFADSRVGTVKFEKRMRISGIDKFLGFHSSEEKYESVMSKLIEQYVRYYDRLVLLKNALVKMGKEKTEKLKIEDEVILFVGLMLRVTLNLFSNFVKMTGLNVGGGYFTHAYLNYSDLSGSNLTGSDFSRAHMEGSIFTDSDLSVSKLDKAHIKDGDFRNVNLGYASLIGAECVCTNFMNAKLTDIIFHSPAVIHRHEIIKIKILKCFDKGSNKELNLEKLRECSADVVKDGKEIEIKDKVGEEKIADLSAATLDNVVLKSVDLSVLKLSGASFDNSVLTSSLWLYTTRADGMKLRNANLRNIFAVQSDFSMSDFQAANLGEAIFVDVNMSQANFGKVNGVSMKVCGSSEKIMLFSGKHKVLLSFNDRQFSSKNFKTNQITDKRGFSKWVQVNFQNVNAVESQWHNTLLNESVFACAILKNTVWKNIGANWANMENCDMTYSTMSDVSFSMAKMISCIFTRAFLKNINFEDANLYKANFIHAYIQNADFIQCNLSYAIFSHTVFQNCRFINCGMHDIYLQSTIFKDTEFDCNSFLIVLKSYNGSERIKFDSCEVRLEEECDYEELCDKLKVKREILIKWERHDDKILINSKWGRKDGKIY